jgi:hypothetical protein
MLNIPLRIQPSGVIVALRVSVSLPKELALRSRRRAIPKPVEVEALLDTGADCSVFDPSVPIGLGLLPTGQCLLRSLDTSLVEESLLVYDADVAFVSDGESSHRFTVRIAAKTLGALPYKMLLGRDILRHCRLVYDGPENEASLTV